MAAVSRALRTVSIGLALQLVVSGAAAAQTLAAPIARPNLEANIARPLRYVPHDGDFVIVNGQESFNRPLYGRNTAFRVDAGDKPEFVMYLPGRGGNLRLGVRRGAHAQWLTEAARVTARYRPGEMIYDISAPLLGAGSTLEIRALALHATDGLILQFTWHSPASASAPELMIGFGGVNGERGVRDGDIGTERVPIGDWFQLSPEFCRGNSFEVSGNVFELRSAVAKIAGTFPPGSKLAIASADRWRDAAQLSASAGARTDTPVLVAFVPLRRRQANYLALQVLARGGAVELDTYRDVTASKAAPAAAAEQFVPPYSVDQLPRVFDETGRHFRALRHRVEVRTPDPYIDAAVGALNVAADATWDEPQGVMMHGAIAWRARLLGWRGAYALDALGWHERARRHIGYWSTRQNTGDIPPDIPAAEQATHLARNPAAIHSNGDFSNSHYDMNLVFVDALFRHLMWTGDLQFARAAWPAIERHLAWEQRLFRREFGPEKLPLYEGYAAIWASDDLQYNGGGATHASAYNWWHNVMAGRLARLLGEDASPFEREARLIGRAMEDYLWLPGQGMFAEYRDYLGARLAHPAAALWSFYHVLDAAGLVDAKRAWQMTRYVDRHLPHLPVRGPGIDGALHHVLATTNWFPYTWSINNVVMGENLHAALGFWQARRPDEAFLLFRSAVLASMYMGISPGNVGTMNYLDVYRRESQRDFADGAGVMARALVEGMFGVAPDALAGEIAFTPGWPTQWRHAQLSSPAVDIGFRRTGRTDHYVIGVKSSAFRLGRMRLPLAYERARVKSGRQSLPSRIVADALGRHWLEVEWPLAGRSELAIQWLGARREESRASLDGIAGVASPAAGDDSNAAAPSKAIDGRAASFVTVDLAPFFNDQLRRIFMPDKYRSPRSPFASLAMPSQGIGSWAGHVNDLPKIDDSGLRSAAAANGGRFLLPGNVPFEIPVRAEVPNVAFVSRWDNYPGSILIPIEGRATRLYLLMAGSTNHMQSHFDNAEIVVEYESGPRQRLALRNPTNWWPIDQDYFIDDFQFRRPGSIPLRVDLLTGAVRSPDPTSFAGHGGKIEGGAATVLEVPLDPQRNVRSVTVTAIANEVVVGLLALTLEK